MSTRTAFAASDLSRFSVTLGLLLALAAPAVAQPDPADGAVFDQVPMGLVPHASDKLGSAVVSGDFNCDHYADLAASIPWDHVSGIGAGAVVVAWGGPDGIDSAHTEVIHQGYGGVPGEPVAEDAFGLAMAVGNFDGEFCDDLAIATPRKNVFWDGLVRNYSGAVIVMRGTPEGFLSFDGEWRQGYDGLQGESISGEYFGEALAAGDFDGDGFDDLAVGIRGENANGIFSSGAVQVIYGSSVGLLVSFVQQDRVFTQEDLAGSSSENDDRFGEVLAAGDFDGDGYDDLAVGMPHEDLGGIDDAGAMFVIYGTEQGLSETGSQFWHEAQPGVPGAPHEWEEFGWALAVGDYDGDGVEDVAVGIPGDSLLDDAGLTIDDFGKVTIFYGQESVGLTGDATVSISGYQLTGQPAQRERFGRALASANFDLDPRDDLLVGAPFAQVDGLERAGRVYVVESGNNRSFAFQSYLSQGGALPGFTQEYDQAGLSVAAGDFDGNGAPDAVMGTPLDGVFDYGTFSVFYSPAVASHHLFSSGFESGDFTGWSAVVGN